MEYLIYTSVFINIVLIYFVVRFRRRALVAQASATVTMYYYNNMTKSYINLCKMIERILPDDSPFKGDIKKNIRDIEAAHFLTFNKPDIDGLK